MKFALGKIQPGSVICDPNIPENFYRVIEHLTIFDGHDLSEGYAGEQYAYGETKRIARCKNIETGKMYRYPSTKKFIYLEGPYEGIGLSGVS